MPTRNMMTKPLLCSLLLVFCFSSSPSESSSSPEYMKYSIDNRGKTPLRTVCRASNGRETSDLLPGHTVSASPVKVFKNTTVICEVMIIEDRVEVKGYFVAFLKKKCANECQWRIYDDGRLELKVGLKWEKSYKLEKSEQEAKRAVVDQFCGGGDDYGDDVGETGPSNVDDPNNPPNPEEVAKKESEPSDVTQSPSMNGEAQNAQQALPPTKGTVRSEAGSEPARAPAKGKDALSETDSKSASAPSRAEASTGARSETDYDYEPTAPPPTKAKASAPTSPARANGKSTQSKPASAPSNAEASASAHPEPDYDYEPASPPTKAKTSSATSPPPSEGKSGKSEPDSEPVSPPLKGSVTSSGASSKTAPPPTKSTETKTNDANALQNSEANGGNKPARSAPVFYSCIKH